MNGCKFTRMNGCKFTVQLQKEKKNPDESTHADKLDFAYSYGLSFMESVV
jgi:hypothetical protein